MRWIDAGVVPPYRSQTHYHGLAHAYGESTPGAVALCTPASPYVCVGYHQDLTREIDTEYCGEHGIPVLRRELGGGAVYLDRNQLFVQWIMPQGRLPRRIEDRFRLFTRPIIETYRELGVEATFHAPNDIHIRGRKVCGTGAALIGEADVLVGNFLFDFDEERMSRILRLDSELMRSEVKLGLERYMTSLRRELGTPPDPEQVQSIYRERCQAVLNESLGEALLTTNLTGEEAQTIEEVERRFRSDDFRLEPGGMKRHGVKIHEHIWIRQETVETSNGAIPIVARVNLVGADGAGTIDRIRIDHEDAPMIEQALAGVRLRREDVQSAIQTVDDTSAIMANSNAIEPWVDAIRRLGGRN